MKRASAFILALLLSLAWSVTVFAEDIFIVEDGEDEFIVNTPTTTKPAETTTASSSSGLEDLIDGDTLSGYFDSFKDKFGDGFDSFMNDLGSWEGFGKNQNTAETTTSIPKVDGGSYVPVTQSAALTTYPSSEPASAERSSDDDTENDKSDEEELPSVLIVNGTDNDDSWGISGSTLTLIVFIAAIIILILVVVVVLVIMTRKTEFDSSVKNKSTIPGVDKSDSLARFIEGDDDGDNSDDENYSNITYWEDE